MILIKECRARGLRKAGYAKRLKFIYGYYWIIHVSMKAIPVLAQLAEAVLNLFVLIFDWSIMSRQCRKQARRTREIICSAIQKEINTTEQLSRIIKLDYFSTRYHLGVLIKAGRIVKCARGPDHHRIFALADHQNGVILKRYANENGAPSFLTSTGWIRLRSRAMPLNEQEADNVLQRQQAIYPVFLYELSPL